MSLVISSALICAIKIQLSVISGQLPVKAERPLHRHVNFAYEPLIRTIEPILQLLRIRKLFFQLLQLTSHGAVVNRATDAHNHSAQELRILVIARPNFLSGGES